MTEAIVLGKILEHLPDAALVVDREGRVALANGLAENLLGPGLVHRKVEDFLPPSLRERHRRSREGYAAAPAARAMGSGLKLSGVRLDGSVFPVDVSLGPLSDGTTLCILRDLTQRLRSEKEALRAQLERLTAAAAMGEYAASAAHEINQPLCAIVANARAGERLLGPGGSAEVREILADIAAEGKRAGEVLQRLRKLLRRESCEPARTDLNQVVREGLARVSPVLEEAGVQVELELARDGAQAAAGFGELEQVLLNLLLNACQAMEDSQRRELRVTTWQSERQACLRLADTGPGLHCEEAEDIFRPFYSTRPEGLGMGLALSRSLAQSLGGSLSVSSQAGEGCSFELRVPLA